MTELANALELARGNRERYLLELKEFLSIPSISTLSEHREDMQRAARWVAGQLSALGLRNAEVIPTDGHPVSYGEWLNAPGQPTVLVYGHYDVQPVDPLNQWITPPFEPTVRGENIFARGASDMKGQVHAFLKALEALIRQGGLSINVKVLVEGEEEVGSRNLSAFLEKYRSKLNCDLALNGDAGIMRPDLPSLVYGLRGFANFDLLVFSAAQDLHSGVFGGSVLNAAQVLCELIAGMHDEKGRVTLPGFYDGVRVLSEGERTELARVPLGDEEWKKTAGVSRLSGEEDFTTPERVGARPTLEVNGILSGFTGEGAKTVIPSGAMAKLSTRLIPYQDDTQVEHQLKEYMRQKAPSGIRWEVQTLFTGPGVLLNRDSAGMSAASNALKETFGVKPVFKLEGGSVPVVNMLKKILGVDSVLLGFGLPDDHYHSPNEKLHLPTYYRGIEAYIRFFDHASRLM